jgi:branched-subunit amino acid aminotransferase/4-amino-4-deoxychorismate lyase
MIVHLEGRFTPADRACISVDDRGFLFGDAVFETALVHAGGFFRLHQHLDRFAASAAGFRLSAPPTGELEDIARRLIRDNRLTDAVLRFTLSRGAGRPLLLVTARPLDTAALERARTGWRVITARTRRPSMAAAPAQLKTVGRPHALLARHEAAEAGVDDALLLNDAGHVCEGPSWNVFWRRGRTLFTPALECGVLAGITRSVIMELMAGLGQPVVEGTFERAELDDVDEVFATMTSAGAVPLTELDGAALPPATELLPVLQRGYRELVAREAAAHPC